MKQNDTVQLAYDFWITEFSTDTITINIDVNKDLKQIVTIPRCIPELGIYPSWLDFKLPADKYMRDGFNIYKIVVPEDFYTSGGRYINKGIRDSIPYFADLKTEFERDMPMSDHLNIRYPGNIISGIIDRMYIKSRNGIEYYEDSDGLTNLTVVFIEPRTLIEYKLSNNLLE